ncbi:hypothetical protein SAMN02799622_00923 [Methylobacterium sp. UNC378MF]|jgi:hypothetical protein|uniref:hypothetical protein n=1 Tax=Methylobacterium sp. UNC378MF TaxID=1502748 RepID=UPI000890AF72|nr:hypothetical protein [Methylobacterium sp. UNC378MF]SDA13149.1 hypothetical protein SAMN02799622_00923 [Methylobacterium sp. UNC378MF]
MEPALRTSDTSAWALAARPIAGGVQLGLDVLGRDLTVALDLTREEARAFARALLAAAGDATERTFPHPQIPEA